MQLIVVSEARKKSLKHLIFSLHSSTSRKKPTSTLFFISYQDIRRMFYGLQINDILECMAACHLFRKHYYVKSAGICDQSRMSNPVYKFKGKNVLIERNTASSTSSMASKSGKPSGERNLQSNWLYYDRCNSFFVFSIVSCLYRLDRGAMQQYKIDIQS